MRFAMIIAMLAFALQGCAGYRSVEPILNPVTGLVEKNRLGIARTKKVKKTEAVALLDSLAPVVANVKYQPVMPCDGQPIAQIAQLSEVGQRGYYNAVSECERGRSMAKLMAYALNRSTDPVEAIAKAFSRSIRSIQDGKSSRTKSVITGISKFGLGSIAGSVIKSGFDASRDIGIAAAENGNTTIGDVTVSPTQSISNSNDPSSGEGSATASVSSANTSGDINLNLGRGNSSYELSDDARLNIAERNVQALEPSSNGNLNEDRQNGVNTADDFTGDTSNSDDDGGNGLL